MKAIQSTLALALLTVSVFGSTQQVDALIKSANDSVVSVVDYHEKGQLSQVSLCGAVYGSYYYLGNATKSSDLSEEDFNRVTSALEEIKETAETYECDTKLYN